MDFQKFDKIRKIRHFASKTMKTTRSQIFHDSIWWPNLNYVDVWDSALLLGGTNIKTSSYLNPKDIKFQSVCILQERMPKTLSCYYVSYHYSIVKIEITIWWHVLREKRITNRVFCLSTGNYWIIYTKTNIVELDCWNNSLNFRHSEQLYRCENS